MLEEIIGTFEKASPFYGENYRKVRFGFEIKSAVLKLFHSGKELCGSVSKKDLEDFILHYCFGNSMMNERTLYLLAWDRKGHLAVKRWV